MTSTHQWLNRSHPTTLQNACILLYLNAALTVLFLTFGGGGLLFLVTLLGAAGAYGIANERKWGYILASIAAIVPLTLDAFWFVTSGGRSLFHANAVIALMFHVLLAVLLFHPNSRNYQRTWFK